MTFPSSSTTGNPLTPNSNSLAASSLNDASLVTEIGWGDRKLEMVQDAVLATTRMADASTRLLLRLAGLPLPDAESPVLRLLGSAGYPAVVHQAAGMVSVQCDCGIDDAQALLAMRAFADGPLLADIAAQVVRGEVRFQ